MVPGGDTPGESVSVEQQRPSGFSLSFERWLPAGNFDLSLAADWQRKEIERDGGIYFEEEPEKLDNDPGAFFKAANLRLLAWRSANPQAPDPRDFFKSLAF